MGNGFLHLLTKMKKKQKQPKQECQVFLLCRNEATTTIPHPILGNVPACQRCADKMARL